MNSENLEIYISYDKLKAKDLALLLHNLSFISDRITEDFYNRFGNGNEAKPSLDIVNINTGNSVKFALTEGWMPEVTSDAENDIVIGIPKKLGIPIAICYLLVSGASKYQDFKNTHLDNQIKEIELELKKHELYKVISEENNENNPNLVNTVYYLDNKVPEVKAKLLDTLKFIYKNPDLNSVKVNNIEIKSIDKIANDSGNAF
ncbi:MAG: hypothetical protein JWN78_772 [Bacteroidota bacterium]|nr:hypothetical protein [Bacteroidota bacterium]